MSDLPDDFKGSTVGYRLVRTDMGGWFRVAIHEVFFGRDGEIEGWTMEPVTIEVQDDPDYLEGLTAIEGLRANLTGMLRALDKPILDGGKKEDV